ncbi:hypothetical protein evm_013738 [Chilo suppressalis]|nr:hypothetical protein evm_013738 [Chilo suppressalis]
MEWTLKEDRVAVIALHRCSYAPIQIFDILKILNITKRFVYRTIKRYNEDSSVDDRSRSGRPRSVIKAVKARIQRNPKMGLSRTPVKRVLNEDLGLRAYRRKTGHSLNARLMDLRLKRCRALLKRYAGKKIREILFSDEKFFTVEERDTTNKMIRCTRTVVKKRATVFSVSNEVIFHPRSWYGTGYSNKIRRPLIERRAQDWLAAREIDFIRQEDWPSSSPDLSPLDYKIWQHLEEKACSKPHPNLESLKTSLIKAAADIDMDLVRAAIDDWPRRLKA